MNIADRNSYNLGTANAAVNRIEADIDAHVRELEEKLPGILEQLEEWQVAQIPPPLPRRELDRAAVRVDVQFTLRHYIDSTASAIWNGCASDA